MKCCCDWQGHATRKNSSGRIREWEWFMHLHLAADSRTIADMGTSFLERFNKVHTFKVLSEPGPFRHYIAWLEVNGSLRQWMLPWPEFVSQMSFRKSLESRPGA
jgi:hypothetical protein